MWQRFHGNRLPALAAECEKCLTPSLLLAMLPVHTLLPAYYCAATEPILASATRDDFGVLAERSGRFATPLHLAFVAMYIRLNDKTSSVFARSWQLRRPRLPSPGQGLLIAAAGATSHRIVESLLLTNATERSWIGADADTAVKRDRHGQWFDDLTNAPTRTGTQSRVIEAERWLFTVKIVVLAPLVEEVLYRGLILRNLCVATGSKVLSVFLSSCGFGLAHGASLHFDSESGDAVVRLPIVEALFGVVASLCYFATGRLSVPIAMHVLVNGSALLREAPGAIPAGQSRMNEWMASFAKTG